MNVLRLANIAERLLAHAKSRKGLVPDGEPARHVIDAEPVRVGYAVRELPSGRQPGHNRS